MSPFAYDTARRACRAAARRYRRGNGVLCRAEDLEAAAMLRLLEGGHDPARSSYRTWAYATARRAVLDYVRSARHTRALRARVVTTDTLERTAADPAPMPDRIADYVLVRDALARLPEPDARVVRLYYLAGLNDREIAERTLRTYAAGQQSPTGRPTVSAAAVYQRRQAAVRSLRSSLTPAQAL